MNFHLRGVKLGSLISCAACLILALAMQYSSLGQRIDGAVMDIQQRILRSALPVSAGPDVVVVGIDDESIRQYDEPLTLWHRHLGDFLQAAAAGRGTAVGLDIVLPERSYNAILPGYDEALMRGILVAKKVMPVVAAITVDGSGAPREVMQKIRLVLGANGTGMALFPLDPDGVVRRFDEQLAMDGDTVPTLTGQMARNIGKEPRAGLIDYSIGNPFNYIPFHEVLNAYRTQDFARLRTFFEGKPVLLGIVVSSLDRVRQPLNLAAWEDNANLAPGVLAHAQALRNISGRGLIQPLADFLVLLLIAAPCVMWFAKKTAVIPVSVLVLWLLGLVAFSSGLYRAGWHVPLSGPFIAALFTLFGIGARDALVILRERMLLKRSLAGAVSPTVMSEIMAGRFSPELGGSRAYVCVLFADIRGFTTMSEVMPPEKVFAFLNRYFERVVQQIHKYDGAVISFMGDGIMAIFGAPKAVTNPCANGFLAAKAIHQEVAEFNRRLIADGLKPIEIGVGLHAGETTVGHVGSSGRHDYTAIGDVTNVASRLESLTKQLGFCIICSREIAAHAEAFEALVALGPQSIKGHTEVEVFGWNRRFGD